MIDFYGTYFEALTFKVGRNYSCIHWCGRQIKKCSWLWFKVTWWNSKLKPEKKVWCWNQSTLYSKPAITFTSCSLFRNHEVPDTAIHWRMRRISSIHLNIFKGLRFFVDHFINFFSVEFKLGNILKHGNLYFSTISNGVPCHFHRPAW